MSLREVLRSLKRGAKGPLGCPKCGRPVRRSRAPFEGWILPVKYVCSECGYEGFIALQEEAVTED